MTYYQETLESAKKIIRESALPLEEKTFLEGLVPRLSFDMLEIFVWTMEEEPHNAALIVEKTRRWIATATDPIEMRTAVEKDKKELEELFASGGVLAL